MSAAKSRRVACIPTYSILWHLPRVPPLPLPPLAKYSSGADHRIALVEFRSNAKIIKDWTAVDPAGAKALKATVNGLRADGATNVGAGMQPPRRDSAPDNRPPPPFHTHTHTPPPPPPP